MRPAAAAGLVAAAAAALPLAAASPIDPEAILLSRQLARSVVVSRQTSTDNSTSSSSDGSSPSSSNSTTSSSSSSSNSTSASDFNYILSTNVYNTSFDAFQPQPYVANGYIGARLPTAGVGYQVFQPTFNNATFHNGTQGWPLFTDRQTATSLAGFYAQLPNDQVVGTNYDIPGGQQVIALLPAWASLFVSVPDATGTYATFSANSDPATVSNYAQSLSIRNGVVSTNLTWSAAGNSSNATSSSNSTSSGVQLSYTVYAHRARPNVGVMRLDVTGLPANATVVVTDALDGSAARRVMNESAGVESSAPNVVFSSVMPAGIPNVTAWEFSAFDVLASGNGSAVSGAQQALANVSAPASVASFLGTNSSTAAQSFVLAAAADGTLSVVKYVGVASSDAYAPNEREQALNASTSARSTGWDALLQEHNQEWETMWAEGGDIQLNNTRGDARVASLQATARASLFHLLANVRRGSEGKGLGDNSIAPAGLTSDSYAGGIFWDAPTWMFPSLLSLFPSFAASINNYYSKIFGQTRLNAAQYNRSGILYPWVSFRYGNCTGIGPCYDYEYHLNNDLALAQWQYYQSTGNKTFLQTEAWPIMKGVSDFWASQVIKNADGSYTTLNETDPDEYANQVNNAAFTNAGLAVTLLNTIAAANELGYTDQVSANWTDIAANITILTTNSTTSPITLEFEGYNASLAVKQADVVLMTYPLEYAGQKDPLADLDFYSAATSPNGPGMTFSTFSIDAAQLAKSGCESFTYLLSSNEPYVRDPYLQFSEQTSDLYAFNGGTNPAYTFLTGHGGYLQTYTHGFTGYRVRTDRFYLDPSLPPQLSEGVTVTGMQYQNNTLDVAVGANMTTVTLRAGNNATSVKLEIAAANKAAGNYTLQPGQSMSVPTRRVDLGSPAVAGNVAQCAAATANVSWVPGSYDIAAVDGSNATYWQPNTVNASSLLVDLGTTQNVSAFHINWGKNPAMSMQILAGADSASLSPVVNSTQVNVSAPYDAAQAALVAILPGNQSDIALAQPTSARYVELIIEGAMIPDQFSHGATVAEFNVISS